MLKTITPPRSVAASTLMLGVFLTLAILTAPLYAAQVLETYEVPENSSGLAWDGRLLWMGGVGDRGDIILGFDPQQGRIVDTLDAPVPDCYGLAWFQDKLAYISPRSNNTYLISRDAPTELLPKPYRYMGGLAGDGDFLWSSSFHNPPHTLVRMDDRARVVMSVPFSGRHCRDMTFHRNFLYAADMLTQEVRVVNPGTGRLVDIFESPGMNPAGLTSDGDFVWLLDDGNKEDGDRLYKVMVREGGGIRLSSLYHNFGSVAINDSRSWDLWVYNDGLRAAGLVNFEAREGNDDIIIPHIGEFPEEIAGGDSARLRFSFVPAYSDSVRILFGLTYDIDRVTNWVDLRGKGVRDQRDIRILNPNRHIDFGIARMGDNVHSSNLRYLLLENNGGEPLRVSEIRFSNNSYSYGLYQFPYTFDEPGLYPIPIYFRPEESGQQQAIMTVVSNADNVPQVQLTLSGIGQFDVYPGGRILWSGSMGSPFEEEPRVRAMTGIGDVSNDGMADVAVATNDYRVQAFHAAASISVTPVWSYNTSTNPWRSGRVRNETGLSSGDDWDGDGVEDLVIGLDAGAMRVIALSGIDGSEIWVFDGHGLDDGGGEVIQVDGKHDFTGDDVRDVVALLRERDELEASKAVLLLDGRNGEVVWQHNFDDNPARVNVLQDVTGDDIPDLAAVCEDGTVEAFDGQHGQGIWDAAIEGEVLDLVILDDANDDGSQEVALVTNSHGMWLYNGSNGRLIWRRPPHEPHWNVFNLTSATPLNDVNGNGSPDLIVGDAERDIWAIDGLTGELAWRTSVVVGTTTLDLSNIEDLNDDGRKEVLAGTSDGRLYCISGDGEGGLWSYGNQGENRGFYLVKGIRDIDGNGIMDALGAMSNGALFCIAGTHINNVSVAEPSDPGLVPQLLSLDPAYPNPFNGAVQFPVRLRSPGEVTLQVFDLAGRRVYSRRTGRLQGGTHRLLWNAASGGAPVPSGTYIVRVESAGAEALQTVNLVR